MTYLASMHIVLLSGKTWMITAPCVPCRAVVRIKGENVCKSTLKPVTLSKYFKRLPLLGGTPTRVGQIVWGDKEEAGIGDWGKKWKNLWRQSVPGEVGASKWRVAEFDPPIQNNQDWACEAWSLKWVVWRPIKGSGTLRYEWRKGLIFERLSLFTCIIFSNLHGNPRWFVSSSFHNWDSETQQS